MTNCPQINYHKKAQIAVSRLSSLHRMHAPQCTPRHTNRFSLARLSLRAATCSPRALPQVATTIMKFLIDNFGVSDLFGRDNYEYYARMSGRVLKVEENWIVAFKYPNDGQSRESALSSASSDRLQGQPSPDWPEADQRFLGCSRPLRGLLQGFSWLPFPFL